jgi:hypothetical protein
VYDTFDSGTQHGSITTEYPRGEPLDAFPVETVAGDVLVREGDVPAPTVAKIDVQGMGVDVLKGLRESFSSDRCRLVYIEAHDNVDRLRELLREMDFSVAEFTLSREDHQPAVLGYDPDVVPHPD